MSAPENYRVNSDLYTVLPGYEDFCFDSASDLQKYPPSSIAKLLERIAPGIKDFYEKADPKYVDEGYGKVRDLDTPPEILEEDEIRTRTTEMVGPYEKTFAHAIKGRWAIGDPPIAITMPVSGASSEPADATLTMIRMTYSRQHKKQIPVIWHFISPYEEQPDNSSHYRGEYAWSRLSSSYRAAMNEKNDPEIRREAAIDTYWWMSHYMPLERGSATAARMTLEFMADHIGFQTGPTKEDVDLNLEALTRNRDTFQRDFSSFFDRNIEQAKPPRLPLSIS